jgi:geranylgeranyl pyrophosphate synthase
MKQPVMTSVNSTLKPVDSKRLVDNYLEPIFAQKINEATQLDPAYATLWRAIQQLHQAGGKRLRSYMTFLVYKAYSDTPIETILPAAAAQELLHLAMLVHDDIIDRDTIRYGVQNVTGQYRHHYEQIVQNEADREHFSESAAILAGDLLLTEAFILTTETNTSTDRIVASQKILAKAIFTVIGGELLDTEASFNTHNAAHPLVIAEQKTASYSFVAPFMMGAIFGGAPPEDTEILKKIGQHMGIAYQLRDDLIGVFGNEDTTGKSAEGDIREGKRTILVTEFERLASESQKETFFTLFGDTAIDSDGVARVRHLLIESGAKTALETTIDTYTRTSLELTEQLSISDEHKATFRELVSLCLQRER